MSMTVEMIELEKKLITIVDVIKEVSAIIGGEKE